MIEDRFEVRKTSGNPDEQLASVRCKQCQHEFDVQLSILRPKNCRFDLTAKSMTIACPQCKAAATTSEHETQVRVLEDIAKRVRKFLNDHAQRLASQFRIDAVLDWTALSMQVTCSRCGRNFPANVSRNLNARWQPGQLWLHCPMCGTAESIDRTKMLERVEVISAVLHLQDIDAALATLKKGGPDAPIGIQASV